MDEREQDTRSDAGAGTTPSGRRPYATPALVEYGSVAKLTQSGGNTLIEVHSKKGKGPCL